MRYGGTIPVERPLWGIPLAGTCAACGVRLGRRACLHVMPTHRRIYHGSPGGYCDLPNPPAPDPVIQHIPEVPEQP